MSVRVVRQSKFRHVFGTAFKRENTFDNIRITRNAWDTPLSSVNPKFLAVALETQGGGQFQVIPVEQVRFQVQLGPPQQLAEQRQTLDLPRRS